eukprot:7938557-Lingulodinium_polyedra.AAC.1
MARRRAVLEGDDGTHLRDQRHLLQHRLDPAEYKSTIGVRKASRSPFWSWSTIVSGSSSFLGPFVSLHKRVSETR